MNKIFHFWVKKPEKERVIEYTFLNQGDFKGQNMISLGFLEEYTSNADWWDLCPIDKNDRKLGPVCSVYFTEDQLVQFIIEAEKALQSIR